MRELERRLDVALFEKVGRRQVLTPVGEELEHFAHSILAQTEGFSGRLEALQRGEAGRLRVGMVDAACLYVMPGALRRFREESPKVELELTVDTSGVLLAKLRDFDLDVAIVVGPVESDDVQARPVVAEPMHIYRPEGASRKPQDARWLLYPAKSHTRRLINDALGREGLVPRIVMEGNNPAVLRQMVAMGLGWSVLPEAVVAADPDGLERHQKKPLVHRELVAVCRADAPPDMRVDRLLELAKAA